MTKDGDKDSAWESVAKTVKPLKSAKKLHHEIPSPKKIRVDSKPSIRSSERVFSRSDREVTIGATTQMDHRTARRFKRGEFRLEGRIDLHGMTLDQAHQALVTFIERSAEAGRRSLLVITGHGLRSSAGRGAIRQQVPVWLNEPSLRRYILAVTEAEPKDGGIGALYVMLKRER